MRTQAAVIDAKPIRPVRWKQWAGYALSALPILTMVMSGLMKISQSPQMQQMLTGKFGYPASTVVPIGLTELMCAALYAVPQTAVFGAVLLTGYLGGAVAAHVRVLDPFGAPLIIAILAWAGLYLRDERLRALLPLRAPAEPAPSAI